MADSENWGDDDENDPDYVPPAEMEIGYITPSSNSNTEEWDSSADEHIDGCNYPFDKDLPTTHRYLGPLNSVKGYTFYDEGEFIETLAIYTTTMVFPGFILPLVMNNNAETALMQNYMEKNKVFVLLCANSTSNGIYSFGVTMEIFESKMVNNYLKVKARGRQRCKLVPDTDITVLAGRLKQVTIEILYEPKITSPLSNTQLLSLKSKRLLTSSDFGEILKNYKYRRYHLAQYPIPAWVYDKYEISYYVKLLTEGLSHYIGDYIPKDPIKLSYWFVQNYQLNHDERLHILKQNSALERLKLEYKYLKLDRKMCCNSCGVEITDPSKVFAMSKEGIQSNYVNPGGHVYETVTVMEAQNFQLIGNPSHNCSWFPGYAWTIMQCKNCSNHLGWRYTSSSLTPNCFYGLAKSGCKVVIHKRTSLTDIDFQLLITTKNTTFTSDYIPI